MPGLGWQWEDDDHPENYMGVAEAKHFYFLDSKDLKVLPYKTFGGGIGCGAPLKLFNPKDVHEVAMRKWGGKEGLEKKRKAREKRQENKRKKEQAAEEARKALANNNKASAASNSSSNDENTNPQASSNKRAKTSNNGSNDAVIKKLRKSMLRMAKKNLGFQYSGAPKDWRFEVPATTPETFAALLGRPEDTDLKTFVKKGAYYSEYAKAREFFQCPEPNDGIDDDLVRFFSREGVGIRIGEDIVVKYKPSTMDLIVNGYGEITPF